MKKKNLLKMTQTGILMAIIVAMTFIPYIGYISIPGFLSITTLAIPVIIGSVVLGPAVGTILGATWGVTNWINAMILATADAIVFQNPLVSVVPRILVGVAAGWAYVGLSKFIKKRPISIIITSIVASLTNTVLVLTALNLFGTSSLFNLGDTIDLIIKVAFGLNGLIEIAVAIIIPLPIVLVL
ncbi:MAG: ECF transporter S component, partial [Oscillospiraceae bacterium]|nr:ECF transporter S component [Oscillospiraceae bacterium]